MELKEFLKLAKGKESTIICYTKKESLEAVKTRWRGSTIRQ